MIIVRREISRKKVKRSPIFLAEMSTKFWKDESEKRQLWKKQKESNSMPQNCNGIKCPEGGPAIRKKQSKALKSYHKQVDAKLIDIQETLGGSFF